MHARMSWLSLSASLVCDMGWDGSVSYLAREKKIEQKNNTKTKKKGLITRTSTIHIHIHFMWRPLLIMLWDILKKKEKGKKPPEVNKYCDTFDAKPLSPGSYSFLKMQKK